jgi:hypothetical protein
LFEKFDGFGMVAGFFEQRCSGIQILERIANNNDQPPEKFERSRRIAGGEPDFGEAQEVGGDEAVFGNFAGKDKFEDFARGLLVASFEQGASRLAQDFRGRRGLRIGAVRRDFGVECAKLRGDFQFVRR